jgi:phytoene dehydrogenase-like protein
MSDMSDVQVVDGLLSICQQAGVQVHTSAAVKAIRSRGGAITGVELQDGTIIPADTVITNV